MASNLDNRYPVVLTSIEEGVAVPVSETAYLEVRLSKHHRIRAYLTEDKGTGNYVLKVLSHGRGVLKIQPKADNACEISVSE